MLQSVFEKYFPQDVLHTLWEWIFKHALTFCWSKQTKNPWAGGRYIRSADVGRKIQKFRNGRIFLFSHRQLLYMYVYSPLRDLFIFWMVKNVYPQSCLQSEKQASYFSNLQKRKNYNYYHPVPKTRKKPGAGGLRVWRASATMWENLSGPKPRRTGQTQGFTPGVWGTLSRESIKLSWRIVPVPVRRDFGTVRFSTS